MDELARQVLILCLTVFFGRIADVTFGSVRTIMLVDGKKFKAAICGFIEVCIWFTIVREALNSDIGGWYVVIAYAGGYATGNIVGGYVAQRLIGEMLSVNIVTSRRDLGIAVQLRDHGYGVTETDCTGKDGSEREMLFIEIKSNKLQQLEKLIDELDPGSFITVSKTKIVVHGFLK